MLHRHREPLLRLFEAVQRLRRCSRQNPLLCLEIQEELIDRISKAERRIRNARTLASAARKELGTKNSDRSRSRAIKQSLQLLDQRIESAKKLINVLRDVGDALAFIYMDRFDVKPLAMKQHAGFITGKRGARLERACLRMIFKQGRVGILNDLTNSLRHADITVFDNDRQFFFIEVKSGRGGSFARKERQVNALREVTEYLLTDVSSTLYESPVVRVAFKNEAKYFTDSVNLMLAKRSESSWREVERGVYLVLMTDDDDLAMQSLIVEMNLKRHLVFMVNELKHVEHAYFPFTLSINNAEALYDFYVGEFVLLIIIDLDVSTAVCRQHGYELEITDDADFPIILKRQDGDGEIGVGRHFLGRVAAEFHSWHSLINDRIERFDRIRADTEKNLS